jgi:hypothetical protein
LLLGSIIADKRWDNIEVNLMFQDPEGVAGKIEHRDRYKNIFVEPELLGCHGARVILLRKIEDEGYAFYINLDDDMLLGEHTNYMPAVEKCLEKGVGFVMTNWARTPKLLEAKLPLEELFPRQIMLYNGGGMAYSEHVASFMRELPPEKTAFDCAWPITAYIEGFVSYRYLGSLTLHRVCTKGGMNEFMKATPLHVMGEKWLRFEPTVKQDGTCKSVRIPLDKDVKPEAKARHKAARKLRFKM